LPGGNIFFPAINEDYGMTFSAQKPKKDAIQNAFFHKIQCAKVKVQTTFG
jgi:hypothetical protein